MRKVKTPGPLEGRDVEALAALVGIDYRCHRCGSDSRIVNGCGCDANNMPTVPVPAGIKSGNGLSRDFMVGWGVVSTYVRLDGVTKRKAERFVAQESRRTMSLGVVAGSEYLRGLRAGLSAAAAA